MYSIVTTVLREATRTVDALPPASPALGSGVGEEVRALARLIERSRVALLERLAVLDASGAVASDGCCSTESWLVAKSGMSRSAAGADMHLARRLHRDRERPLAATAKALRASTITTEHARVVARATDPLPAEVSPEAEALLLQAAVRLAPAQLRVAGRRLRRLLLEDDTERAAAARGDRYVRLTPAMWGMWSVDGLIDAETGAGLQAAFDALLPRHAAAPAAVGGAEPAQRTPAQGRADALGEIVRGWLENGAPVAGGVRPHLVVTVDLDTLVRAASGHGVVRPDSRTGAGTEISADSIRRLGCDAGVTVLVGRADAVEPGDRCVDPDLWRRVLAGIAPALGGVRFEPLALGRS